MYEDAIQQVQEVQKLRADEQAKVVLLQQAYTDQISSLNEQISDLNT